MVIKYIWRTTRYNKRRHEQYARDWNGWFLFGFIPLYIRNIHLNIR